MTFKTNKIGNTEINVTEISFGCSSIANIADVLSDQDSMDVLQAAWDHGIRYFDTAPHYGRGRSETRLGQFLATKERNEYRISTKVGRVLTPGEQLDFVDGFRDPLPNAVHYDYTAKGFEECLKGNCERLGVDFIDIIFVHDIGEFTHGADNAKHFKNLMESGFPYLEKLKKEGKIGAYGLGVNENEVCVEVMKQTSIDVILLAGRLTLMDRSSEKELLPLCEQMGTSIVIGGVFNSGILATGAKKGAQFNYADAPEDVMIKVNKIEKHVQSVGASLPAAAMHFALHHPMVSSMLIGTGKQSSLDRNMSAMGKNINPRAWTELPAGALIV